MNANPTSTPPVESTIDAAAQANLDLAENLREAAHWLEMHAGDMPAPWLAYVHFRSVYANGGNAREELTAFAAAVGDRAREEQMGGEVEISAKFGLLKLVIAARVADLRDGPPEPEYEPILKERRDA